MKELARFVYALAPSELKMIKGMYEVKPNSANTKKWKLICGLKSGKISSNTDAARLLFPKDTSPANISKLKERVKEDIFNMLLVSPMGKSEYKSLKHCELKAYRFLLLGELLISRGLEEEGLKQIKKAREIAQKAELQLILLAANECIRSSGHLEEGKLASDEYLSQFKHHLELYKQLISAKEASRTIRNGAKVVDVLQDKGFQQHNVGKQGPIKLPGNSFRAYFWSNWVATCHYLQEKKFDFAVQKGAHLLELIREKPYVCTIDNRRLIHLSLAKSYFYLKKYPEATNQAQLALESATKRRVLDYEAAQVRVIALFRSNELKLAEDQIRQVLGQARESGHIFQMNCWKYYQSVHAYLSQDTKKALQLLVSHPGFSMKNREWTLGMKLFEIQLLISLEEFDWVEFRLEAFRKALAKGAIQHKARYVLILRLLNILKRDSFDFPSLKNEYQKEMGLLCAGEGIYSWKPLGPEVIPFHIWLSERIGQSIKPFKVMAG